TTLRRGPTSTATRSPPPGPACGVGREAVADHRHRRDPDAPVADVVVPVAVGGQRRIELPIGAGVVAFVVLRRAVVVVIHLALAVLVGVDRLLFVLVLIVVVGRHLLRGRPTCRDSQAREHGHEREHLHGICLDPWDGGRAILIHGTYPYHPPEPRAGKRIECRKARGGR